MVLKRRIECGFIGYDAPNVPRARRSVRKRSLCKKEFNDGQLCAFELLAAVAGKLLQESESSSASSSAAVVVDNRNSSEEFIKQETQHHVDEAMRTELEEAGSSEESVVSSTHHLQKCNQNDSPKESADALSQAILKQTSAVSNYSCSAKVGSDVKPVIIHRSENEFNKASSKTDGGSPKCGESFGPNIDNGVATFRPCQEVNVGTGEVIGTADKFSSKDWVESCGKPLPQIHSGNKANLVLGSSSAPDASYAKHRNDVKVDVTDDDEILSQLTDPRSQEKPYRLPTRVGDLRIKRLLTSKYWKSAPKLKDFKPTNCGSKRNNFYPNDISCYDHERFQQTTTFKKRKLFGKSSTITYDGGISSESISNPSDKGVHHERDSLLKPQAGNRISSSSIDCQRSFRSRNSHVKLSIKSFIVPELLIEVPESTTVSSLKKTVMEAVTTLLGGELRVGVLLHGKKIRDDNRTLLQTGISKEDNLDDLGFILEPSSANQLSTNPLHEDFPAQPTCSSPKDYVNRSLNPKEELSLLDMPTTPPVTDSGRNCQDLVPFSAPELDKKPASDSRALVPVQENVEALAVAPMNARPRRSEIGQRRTRRPFSVLEVEALVQAVEKLGTGRWRDVKLCAFENAKHRTYVDLKDKWKTLVHTARISPQQRRGEPVPQELLDRVLAAHAYWSQHQAKQNGNSNQAGMLKISDSPAEKVAA